MNQFNQFELAAITPEAAGRLPPLVRPPQSSAAVLGDASNKLPGRDSIATYFLEGVITPWLLESFRNWLRRASEASSVKSVIVRIDSPGGYVFGVPETALALREFVKNKPLYVIAENYLASAAYWIASGATKVYATPTTLVGSVGVINVLADDSARFEAEGIRIIPIASSDAKSDGIPGTEVTEEQIARVRNRVQTVLAMFLRDLRQGGRPKTAAQLMEALSADIWYAAEAKQRGLVDVVLPTEEAIDLVREVSPKQPPRLSDVEAYDRLHELAAAQFGIRFLCELSPSQEKQLQQSHPELALQVEQHEQARHERLQQKMRTGF